MAGFGRSDVRLGWLDGLRGLAAMQVVLLHYVFALHPAFGSTSRLTLQDFWWWDFIRMPLIFLYDGASAVYLFFIISGVALTYAFNAHPFAFLPTVMGRLIRLGVPMAAATLLAAALFAVLPDAHFVAGHRTGSSWFADIGPIEISLAAIIHQIALEGLLAGFGDSSLLPGWAIKLISSTAAAKAFDAPLWTLHIEFYGSLLVLSLVALRASVSRTAYLATCVVLGYACALSPLSRFIVGHLAAAHLGHVGGRLRQNALGWLFLGSGILFCTLRTVVPVTLLWRWLPQPPLGLAGDPAVLQKMIGATLVFGGLALLPVLQRQLQRRLLRGLGRISFSLYLSHLPLLATCAAAGFILLDGVLPDGFSVALTCVAGIATSLAAAVLFERWIDRPAILWSRAVRGQPLWRPLGRGVACTAEAHRL